ncbi:MAG: ATP12 family chaperone protein [Paracoccaceae bacterium]|jgi:chaperone required for assembly of F1-ATPase
MSEWKQKRFWKTVDVVKVEGGFTVELDGRRVKTPAKALLVVPKKALAQEVAAEWDSQSEHIDPLSMPFTRTVNAAIDKVSIQHGEVADMLAAYGDSDLLCYRAEGPNSLVARQASHWDPVLNWASETLEVKLDARAGVMHIAQDVGEMAKLTAKVHAMDDFQLAAFHDLVGLSGSLVLGFAAISGWKPADEVWSLSRLDELWQEEQWGADEEAQDAAEVKRAAFMHAERFYSLLT